MKATSSGANKPVVRRFLTLRDLTEVLNISDAQAYALVRSGEMPAIKVGGRGQWRVEASELENYIARNYAETREFIAAHPFGAAKDDPDRPDGLDNDSDDADDSDDSDDAGAS